MLVCAAMVTLSAMIACKQNANNQTRNDMIQINYHTLYVEDCKVFYSEAGSCRGAFVRRYNKDNMYNFK